MRQRKFAIAIFILLLVACAGAFLGARWLYTRLLSDLGYVVDWTPPTVTAGAATLEPPVGELTPAGPAPTRPVVLTPFVPAATPTARNGLTTNPVTSEPATETPEAVTPSPTPAHSFAFTLARSIRNTTGDCPGTYILGQVTDRAGNPLSGVRLRLVDEYGNMAEATTKSGNDDAGRYDFPVAGPPRSFTLTVLDADGTTASATVQISHGKGSEAEATCHWVDWRRR